MKCPKCGSALRVVNSFIRSFINARYRKKKCVSCDVIVSSLEVIVEDKAIKNERLARSSILIPLHLGGLYVGQIAYIKEMIRKFEKDNEGINRHAMF